MDWIENKKVQIVGVILILIASIFVTIHRSNKLETYKNNGDVVIGKIIDCYSLGLEASWYVEYEYVVNKTLYANSFNTTNSYIIDCSKTKNCIGDKIKVYFDSNNPSKSLLDI